MNDVKKPLPAAGAEMVTKKLSLRMAERYGVEPAQLMNTLKATAFHVKDKEITDAQMIALLVVADQYGLNPFTKEIYAYPDSKTGGIVPVVGVDGWHRIINRAENFNGIEYAQSEEWTETEGGKPCPEWMEARIFIKGREKPCVVREYLDECFRKTSYSSPWQSHTKRMLRHKVTIQCARIAFGFAGIYDEDEAERIVENTEFEVVSSKPKVKMPTERPQISNGNDRKQAQAPGSTPSEPKDTAKNGIAKSEPVKSVSLDNDKYLAEVKKVGIRLDQYGLKPAEVQGKLIKAGFPADATKAKPEEYGEILVLLYGLMGEMWMEAPQ